MSHIHVPSEIPIQYLPRSKKWDRVFLGMFVVGLAGFLYARSVDPDRAWQSYVSNWLFFTNIAMGAVLLTVVTWITGAPARRARASMRFVPAITRSHSASGTGSEAMAGSRFPRWQSMVIAAVFPGSRRRAALWSFPSWPPGAPTSTAGPPPPVAPARGDRPGPGATLVCALVLPRHRWKG